MKYNTNVVIDYYAEHGIDLVPEHYFHPERRWRFDFVVKSKALHSKDNDVKVAIEVDGGLFSGGRHSRGAGAVKDMEKLNTALTLGWRVVRTTPQDVCMIDTVEIVKKVIEVANESNGRTRNNPSASRKRSSVPSRVSTVDVEQAA